jgi:hypothetical protein
MADVGLNGLWGGGVQSQVKQDLRILGEFNNSVRLLFKVLLFGTAGSLCEAADLREDGGVELVRRWGGGGGRGGRGDVVRKVLMSLKDLNKGGGGGDVVEAGVDLHVRGDPRAVEVAPQLPQLLPHSRRQVLVVVLVLKQPMMIRRISVKHALSAGVVRPLVRSLH